LEKLVLGEHAEKKILTATGETVKAFNRQPESQASSAIRKYKADISSLAWIIDIRIAEEDLFSDVIALKRKNTLFIAAIIVFALVVSLVFSHKFTKPFGKIIAGTKAYASGNLTFRIKLKSGREAKQLATAFNDMACQLDERQMELNQSVRLASLGMMTAGIGHEIKNPLTGIKTSSQVINRMLLSTRLPPENDENYLEIAELAKGISDEADRLTKILNDLLELGKPRKPEMKIININDIVQRVVDIIQPEFTKRQVNLDICVQPLQVFVDPDQILQVMLNLLLNGLEAVADNNGEVAIVSETSTSGSAVLRIVDNGVGITEDKLQHIFDPFFSLRKEGTGLGLSVVYTLLKQNNATIRVTSKINEGTAFNITFAPVTHLERIDFND
jgi:signal transduction histidine kinase